MDWSFSLTRAARRYLRHDFRTLVAVGLLLGLGSAAVVTTAGMMWAVWGRPLPYGDPHELVRVNAVGQGVSGISPAEFADWVERQATLADLASYEIRTAEVVTGPSVRVVSVASVTPNLLAVLKTRPPAGRDLSPADADDPRLPALISHRLRTALGRSDGVIGTTLQVRDAVTEWSVHVVGVLAPEFELTFTDPIDVYLPLKADPRDRGGSKRRLTSRTVVARLKPGHDIASAQLDLTRVVRQLEQDYPEQPRGRTILVEQLHNSLLGPARSILTLYLVVGVGVLVIAIFNAAALLLAAAVARSREVGIRIALGASGKMLRREICVRALVLAAVVSPLAFLAASLLSSTVIQLEPNSLPRFGTLARPVRFGFLSASLGVGIASLLVVAADRMGLRVANVRAVFGTSSVGPSSGVSPFRRGLVPVQVGLGLPILILGGLLSRSADRMVDRPLGFQIDSLVVAEVRIPSQLRSADTFRSTIDGVLLAVGAAGFEGGIAFEPPLARIPGRTRVSIAGGESAEVVHGIVTEGYWSALGIAAERGRVFQRSDRLGSPVAVVNSEFAKRYLAGTGSALGRQILVGATSHTVVGVVPDVQDLSIRNELRPAVYVPFDTNSWRPARFAIIGRRLDDPRSSSDDLRTAVLQAIPNVAVRASPLNQRLAQDLEPIRFAAVALRVLAIVSVILLTTGIVAVVTASVAARHKEFGIRLAIGASPSGVRWLVVAELWRPISIGIIAGLTGTALCVNLVQNLLFETGPFEAETWASALALLVIVAILAAWTATRRIRRVEPSDLLRDAASVRQ